MLHGNKTYLLQDEDGQIIEAHSISAGLDYPGIGPEHSWLKESGRVDYDSVTDDEALDAFQLLCRTEGIIPALEPSHAIAAVVREAVKMDRDQIILANLCGAGTRIFSRSLRRWGRRFEGELEWKDGFASSIGSSTVSRPRNSQVAQCLRRKHVRIVTRMICSIASCFDVANAQQTSVRG